MLAYLPLSRQFNKAGLTRVCNKHCCTLQFGEETVLREDCREDVGSRLAIKPAEDVVHKEEVRLPIDSASKGLWQDD